ncbi:MAG: TauD/TfdA family dioxygenase [Acidobacteriota bacterium]|nr:TauD/TfdA family dioxygenase [Acidobacteriota bacterium]
MTQASIASEVEFLSLGQGTGIQVRGLSLKEVPSAGLVDLLRIELAKEGVLLFRDQEDVSEEEQIAFTAAFGSTQGHPLPGVGGFDPVENAHPHTFYLTHGIEGYNPQDAAANERKRNEERAENKHDKGGIGEGELGWHTDLQYMPEPQVYSLLYGIEVPEGGGETEWCNMSLAYDGLEEATKERIAGLKAIHWYSRRIPPVLHPVVRLHPITRAKTLYVSPGLSRLIDGWQDDDGKALIQELAEHATQPRFCYLHEWRRGDALMWDNRCTMHRRRSFDTSQTRVVRRTQTEGEAVIGG